MPTSQLNGWEILAERVCGPTHVRSGLPNQDYYARHKSAGSIIVAVSDGHGSTRSFRSDRGSKFAAETAIEVVENFFLGEWVRLSLRDKQQQLEFRLPTRIVGEWREKVRRDLDEFPLSEADHETLATYKTAKQKPNPEAIPYIVYGATLLTVVITAEFVVYLQLGDGDILIVPELGDVFRPFPTDERLIGNETTSLSSGNAANDFRVCIESSTQVLPSLILMATDGYSNSFRDDASFFKAGLDFRHLLESIDGSAEVERRLKEWLEESAQMSGDDVTLCLLHRKANPKDDTPSADRSVDASNDLKSSPNTDDRNPSASNITNSIQEQFIAGNEILPDGEAT